MQRLDEFVERRHTLQKSYDDLLNDLPIIRPHQDQDSYSALHLYPIQIELNKVNKSRKQIFNELRQNGIGVNVHYIPIHTQPYYQQQGFELGDFPNAEDFYGRAIGIPLYPSMNKQDQSVVVTTILDILHA